LRIECGHCADQFQAGNDDMNVRSWRPEIYDDALGQWTGPDLRFATKVEAENEACAMSVRCETASNHDAVPSPDVVNARWDYNKHCAVSI
jgi:hypothetical protein